MKRVAIVGTTGSGKTTLAEEIGRKRGIPVFDLDAYFWQPGWVETPRPLFRERVAGLATAEAWVMSGNYRFVRPVVWGRADTLIWLDYNLGVILWRLLRRTVKRIRTQEELWGGNRETWRAQFASRESLFVYAVQTHEERRREIPQALQAPEYSHLEVFRFRSSGETEEWVKNI